jgi:hypothetical protein
VKTSATFSDRGWLWAHLAIGTANLSAMGADRGWPERREQPIDALQ